MRVIVSSVATALALVLVPPSAHADKLRLNGWFPCGTTTEVPGLDPSFMPFECAEVTVPLCHEGICQSSKTIDIFVRRMLANTTAPAKSLWVLQGGPGGSSLAMEGSMNMLYELLDQQANLYTMDHRGTGRSFFLDCQASQSFTPGSPGGVKVDPMEMPQCAQDLLFQIDNQTAAFSVTSAAKDMEYLTKQLNAGDKETYVYGVSYGTYLTERIMHLAPSHINGYILDGVVPEDNPSFATTNPDRIPPAKRLAQYCEESSQCADMYKELKAKHGGVYASWLAIFKQLESTKPGENACADVFRMGNKTAIQVSDMIKMVLTEYPSDSIKRSLLPAILLRLSRCKDGDATSLKALFSDQLNQLALHPNATTNGTATEPMGPPPGPTMFDIYGEMSPMLAGVIKASEMWTTPSPSWNDEMSIIRNSSFPIFTSMDFLIVCAFRGDPKDPSCTAAEMFGALQDKDYSSFTSNLTPFMYKTDKFYRQVTKIPKGTNVLVMNGKLDFATVSEGGVRQFGNMTGGGKMMVEFDYGGHGIALMPTSPLDDTSCGSRIVASFVNVSGKVDKVDASCIEMLPDLHLLSDAELSMYIKNPEEYQFPNQTLVHNKTIGHVTVVPYTGKDADAAGPVPAPKSGAAAAAIMSTASVALLAVATLLA
ncbi:hypothetical protein P43SY_007651 [Pythium insidiosum]|uniref:AB hydrolase-1 domain-containing protein n=1 Tax=Pythium insidiosum TaxID=114742 RepID=A0AAD5LKV4_PYTIN|nr:hypothetical protein P43SY_007651 [Pythium insidiosum]